MDKKYDIVSIGTVAYDMILRTVDETAFQRDTTLLRDVGVSSGGAAMIQTITAARLGCKTAIVGKMAKDVFGTYLLNELRAAGVDSDYLIQSPDAKTALTFALVREDGNRHFLGYTGSTNQTLCVQEINLEVIKQAKIVSYGSFFWMKSLDQTGVSILLHTAKEAGAQTVADCASDSFHQGKEIVLRNLPLIDYFIPSYVEAEYLTGEKEPEVMAHKLLGAGCRNVIIKLGAEGCLVTDGKQEKRIAAIHSKEVCDTTGAGDSFVGGFMAGLIDGKDIWNSAEYANAVAAVSVTGLGALTALRNKQQVLKMIGKE